MQHLNPLPGKSRGNKQGHCVGLISQQQGLINLPDTVFPLVGDCLTSGQSTDYSPPWRLGQLTAEKTAMPAPKGSRAFYCHNKIVKYIY